MSKPKAVLISDLHFTPATIELASKALCMAQEKAISLGVPLIIAGDTLDSKAIMRAECVNELIRIFKQYNWSYGRYILVGNHDLLNEKASAHSLEFLKPYITVVDVPLRVHELGMILIPYQHDLTYLKDLLSSNTHEVYPNLICHQGVQTAYMGHYTQDKTSLSPEAFKDFRTISGHYHRAQDIKCGPPRKNAKGLFSYIGTSYTTSFAEASDGPKGFKILHDDGILELVPTNLRKHVIVEREFLELHVPEPGINTNDLIWLKVHGLRSELDSIDKQELGLRLFGNTNYKLELIPLVSENGILITKEKTSEFDIFDSIIDNTDETLEQKAYLKDLWRQLLNEDS